MQLPFDSHQTKESNFFATQENTTSGHFQVKMASLWFIYNHTQFRTWLILQEKWTFLVCHSCLLDNWAFPAHWQFLPFSPVLVCFFPHTVPCLPKPLYWHLGRRGNAERMAMGGSNSQEGLPFNRDTFASAAARVFSIIDFFQ